MTSPSPAPTWMDTGRGERPQKTPVCHARFMRELLDLNVGVQIKILFVFLYYPSAPQHLPLVPRHQMASWLHADNIPPH